MYTLITGATGLLGSHLLALAQAEGRLVRATSRSVRPGSWIKNNLSSIDHWPVDLAGESPIPEELFAGVDTVIHCAAHAATDALSQGEMWKTNVLGTQRLFDKAVNSGVKTWIQISSTASGFGSQKAARPTPYGESKREIDRWLLDRTSNMRILFIEPGYMLGRWDSRPSSGAIFFWLRFRKMSHFIEGEKNFVAAEDVARGVWQASDKSVTGRYPLGGDNVKISTFIREACAAMGIDHSMFRAISRGAIEHPREDSAISGVEAALIREFCLSGPLNYDAATHDFGYMPRLGLRDMIDDAVTYLKLKGRARH